MSVGYNGISGTMTRADGSAPQVVTSQDRYFFLLGPLKKYLDDDLVTNIEVTEGDEGSIFVNRFGDGTFEARETMSREKRKSLISWLASETGYGRTIDHLHSRLQCDAPYYGSRVQAFAEPISDWTLIWRQHRKIVFSLEEYLEKHEISQEGFDFCCDAVKRNLNLGIAGSTDSGKTTFMNACLKKKAELLPRMRPVVVQDRKEVRVDGFRNRLRIMARVEQAKANGELTVYEFSDALEDGLRSNVGFLVWGEVRDGLSAKGLMLAVNTGTKGLLYTSHANSCADLPVRIEDLVRLEKFEPRPRMIATMNQAAVFLEKGDDDRRRVVECGYITEVNERGEYVYERAA